MTVSRHPLWEVTLVPCNSGHLLGFQTANKKKCVFSYRCKCMHWYMHTHFYWSNGDRRKGYLSRNQVIFKINKTNNDSVVCLSRRTSLKRRVAFPNATQSFYGYCLRLNRQVEFGVGETYENHINRSYQTGGTRFLSWTYFLENNVLWKGKFPFLTLFPFIAQLKRKLLCKRPSLSHLQTLCLTL